VSKQPLIAEFIGLALGVLSAVQLNYQTLSATEEIHDIWTNRLLPNKLLAAKSPGSQPAPQFQLSVCRIAPEAPGQCRL
jgi:hypothetical protein